MGIPRHRQEVNPRISLERADKASGGGREAVDAPPLRKSVPDSELLSPEGRDFFLNTSSLLPNNFRHNSALSVQPDV